MLLCLCIWLYIYIINLNLIFLNVYIIFVVRYVDFFVWLFGDIRRLYCEMLMLSCVYLWNVNVKC